MLGWSLSGSRTYVGAGAEAWAEAGARVWLGLGLGIGLRRSMVMEFGSELELRFRAGDGV